MSSVVVDEDSRNKFNELKLAQAYRYLLFTLAPLPQQEQVSLSLLKSVEAAASTSWKALEQELVEDQCMYAIFTFEAKSEDEEKKYFTVLIVWVPEGANDELLYVTHAGSLREVLVGIDVDIQAKEARAVLPSIRKAITVAAADPQEKAESMLLAWMKSS